jgi:hypothetical protein
LRGVLRDFLTQTGAPFPWTPESNDYFGRDLVYLVLASPEYQVQ